MSAPFPRSSPQSLADRRGQGHGGHPTLRPILLHLRDGTRYDVTTFAHLFVAGLVASFLLGVAAASLVGWMAL